jgi:hypothetical protein
MIDSVVLPLPRKPVRIDTGKGSSGIARSWPSGVVGALTAPPCDAE